MLKTRRSSTRNTNYFVSYVDDGQRASGLASKRHAEALALMISHPGLGVGRSTCVMKESWAGTRSGMVENTGICFVKGVPSNRPKARKRKAR